MVNEVTKAVVLAGGEGTRLRPLTNTRPKPLLPVLGRPCVEYVIRSLAYAGIEQVFLACGYKSADIVSVLGDAKELGVDLVYAFEEEPAGTAGAVKLLENQLEGTFVVASGDVLADVNIGQLIRFHKEKRALGTMALTEMERPQEFGIVGLDDSGRIVRFKEKPAPSEVFSNLINAGIYVLESDALSLIPEAEKFDFSKNLFPALLSAGKPLFGSKLRGLWKDIGRPGDLLEANVKMAARKGIRVEAEGVSISGSVCATTFFATGAVLEGPLYLGDGVKVGTGTRLSSSAVGSGTVIGVGSEIHRSLLMDRCCLSDNCIVKGSLLGEGCSLGAGVALVNSVLGDGVTLEGPISLEGKTIE